MKFDDKGVWLSTIGSVQQHKNICGFAALVVAFNKVLIKPEYFYGDRTALAANKFLNTYMQELLVFNNHKVANLLLIELIGLSRIEQQQRCALALKSAFAKHCLQDNSGASPFERIFALLIVDYLRNGAAELADYKDCIADFLQANLLALQNSYAAFKLYSPDKSDCGVAFLDFLTQNQPELVAKAKSHFVANIMDPKNSYRARELDIIYMVDNTDAFKSIAIHMQRNIVVAQRLNRYSTVEFNVRNTGDHWESADIVVPAEFLILNQYNSYLYTPLTKAVKLQSLEICKSLVACGADINAPNGLGNTALHIAVDVENVKIVRWLLQNGANPAAINNNFATPADIAKQKSDLMFALLFLGQHKFALDFANINATNKSFYTPLSKAVKLGDLAACKALVAACGADVNAQNFFGNTALHIAADTQNAAIYTWLLQQGADKNISNNNGVTVTALAKQKFRPNA